MFVRATHSYKYVYVHVYRQHVPLNDGKDYKVKRNQIVHDWVGREQHLQCISYN